VAAVADLAAAAAEAAAVFAAVVASAIAVDDALRVPDALWVKSGVRVPPMTIIRPEADEPDVVVDEDVESVDPVSSVGVVGRTTGGIARAERACAEVSTGTGVVVALVVEAEASEDLARSDFLS